MEDEVIQGFTQAIFEISKGGLTRDKAMANACIEAVVLSLNGIAHHMKKGFHVGILFEGVEQFDQEKTDRVVGEANETVSVGYDGADKGEVYQRRDKSGKAAADAAIRVDFNIPTLVGVLRQPEVPRLWEGVIVLGIDTNMNTVEFLDDAAQTEGSEVPSQASSPCLRVGECRNWVLPRNPEW